MGAQDIRGVGLASMGMRTLEEKRKQRAAYMRQWRIGKLDKRTEAGKTRRYAWMSQRRRDRKKGDPSYALREHMRALGGRSPAAHRAQETVRRAVRSGRLVRPSMCQQCGAIGTVEAGTAPLKRAPT